MILCFSLHCRFRYNIKYDLQIIFIRFYQKRLFLISFIRQLIVKMSPSHHTTVLSLTNIKNYRQTSNRIFQIISVVGLFIALTYFLFIRRPISVRSTSLSVLEHNIDAASENGGIYDPTFPIFAAANSSSGALLIDPNSNPSLCYAYPRRDNIHITHDYISYDQQ